MVPKVQDIGKSMYIITYIDKILPNLIKEQTPIQEGKGKFFIKKKQRETRRTTSYQYTTPKSTSALIEVEK